MAAVLDHSGVTEGVIMDVPEIEGFETLSVKSTSDYVTFLINILNEDDVHQWLQKYCELTSTKFNVKRSVPFATNRAQDFKSFVCHHGSQKRNYNMSYKTRTG